MKIIILVCIFVVSATGMSSATEPVRKYYGTYCGSIETANKAMILGLAASMLF